MKCNTLSSIGVTLGIALILLSLPALASVTEPNKLVVPIDSTSTSHEVQLYTLFANRGESIDWLKDAATNPQVFSPLCDFTATFVLKQSGSSLGVGWYNADPAATTAPTMSDIHVVVPAGSKVGLQVNGADIRSDPNYKGGLIGFALVGGQLHYTETKWNVTCTSCSTMAPWILSLTYVSTKTPNAFYVAFEDGGVSASGFGNDGDYNDYVFFFQGLTCTGAGQPCATGKSGVCGSGLTSCAAAGLLSCQQVNQPSTEVCDGLDNDCNGLVDDNAPCQMGYVCDRGQCVSHCGAEFPCAAGYSCQNQVCVESACAGMTCPAGQLCRGGACKSPCDGITCPAPTACRVGRCVEPCAGVTCPMGDVCTGGVCVTACSCQPCSTGLMCQASTGQCLDPSCVNLSCGEGLACSKGNCVPACAGAVCPAGEHCLLGMCQPVPLDMSVPPDLFSRYDAAVQAPGVDAGPGQQGGALTGCGCRVGGRAGDDASLPALALALAALALLRAGAGTSRFRRFRRPG